MPGIRTLWSAYQRDIGAARARVLSGSHVTTTPCGPIEYAVVGDGPEASLVAHGAGGGFDQGLDAAAALVQAGFRVIAPSRFGYLRSPMPRDASPAAQADAYASLLDALNVHRVVMVGVSAGGPSAMQFALRHPDRTAALILMVPLAYPAGSAPRASGSRPQRMSSVAEWFLNAALSSDFAFWAALRFFPRTMIRIVLGTQPAAVKKASPEEQVRVKTILGHILPITPRGPGLLNDTAVATALPRYELERIVAPTLVVAVEDCLYGTYPGARFCAEHIPGTRLVTFRNGGHLWVGHNDKVIEEVERFLNQHARVARAS